jgi:hypothetical protein
MVRRQRAALTRAVNSGDPERVIIACRDAVGANIPMAVPSVPSPSALTVRPAIAACAAFTNLKGGSTMTTRRQSPAAGRSETKDSPAPPMTTYDPATSSLRMSRSLTSRTHCAK